ncbi:MAG: C40 family peptidase [Pseudomonas balearica]|uniref:NlpC/P60 family protein n=1 Tax=Stutzerimonas balearica TaxID=74829 RepID=UPI0019B2388C|nr:NlpC/P60 family protein [Stutzerimonas balearica]MBC7198134.1 C40 family peptidase [Stutzerimonas balearica]
MFDAHFDQIKAQAIEAFPREAVWLITKGGCQQVENVHEDPENFFSISEAGARRAMSAGLLAVVHSHPSNIAAPSAADMQGQINTAVPWGIVATDGVVCSDSVWWGPGVEMQPLIGRGFRHGTADCYSLIRDYYRLKRGVTLQEFPRDWLWWEAGETHFVDGFPRAGFVRIDEDDARPGDVWLAQIRSDTPNHGGILLEDELILHQPGGKVPVELSKLSVREPVFRYRRHITHWLRYAG